MRPVFSGELSLRVDEVCEHWVSLNQKIGEGMSAWACARVWSWWILRWACEYLYFCQTAVKKKNKKITLRRCKGWYGGGSRSVEVSGDSTALKMFPSWSKQSMPQTTINITPADMPVLMQVYSLAAAAGCINGWRGVMETRSGGSGSRHISDKAHQLSVVCPVRSTRQLTLCVLPHQKVIANIMWLRFISLNL